MSRPWIKAADLILAAVIVIGSCIPLFPGGKDASQVEIYHNSELVCTLPLDEDDTVTVNGVEITVRSGVAFVSKSDCPDGHCMDFGELKKGGDSAVCLPNRVTVTVVGKDVDGVTY